MNEDRYFIIGITAENEQAVISKLERSGFTNWWQLPEDTADYIYVSTTFGNQYIKLWGNIKGDYNLVRIKAEDYLCEGVSK